MAEINKNFIGLVALGRLNPQILNVDFLKDNKIVPTDKPPFDKLFQQEEPFTRFVSTPVLSELLLENIQFIIEGGRFKIRDVDISEWAETKVLDIARKYFEVLHYTPLTVVGVNLNATITFGTPEESVNFQQLFLSENSKVLEIISKDNVDADLVLRYPYSDDGARITLTLNQDTKATNKRVVNFNYEFDFTDWTNFNSELSKFQQIGEYFNSVLSQLLKVI